VTTSNSTLEPASRDSASVARGWDRFALCAIAAGAAIRLVWALAFHPAFKYAYSDAGGYLDRATRLAHGGPFERFDTFYPPGVHVLLALPLRIFGTGRTGQWAAAVLWSLLSCVIPILVWSIARRLVGVRAAAIATGLTAASPLFIAYGGFFMSEIPSITALLSAVLFGLRTSEESGRRRLAFGVLTGFLCGACIVMRPQLGLNVLIVGWWMLRKREGRRPLAAAAAAGLLIPIAGIVSLNYAIAGRPVVSENAGVQFLQAHCPVHTAYYGADPKHGYYFMAAPPYVQLDRGRDYVFPDGFPTQQGFQFKEGFRCIRKDGITHVGVVLRNVGDMGLTTVPWPPSDERGLRRFVWPANVVYSLALPLIIVSSVVVMRRKRALGMFASEGILLAHMAPIVILAVLFVGDPRYRLPYDAFGLILASSLIVSWIARAQQHTEASSGSSVEGQAGAPASVVED